MKYSFHSHSARDTVGFGKELGRRLTAGAVVALTGELGSGKTTLIKGFAEGLGIPSRNVKSPTFVILHIYKAKFPVYHFDLYRMERASELEAVGFEEFLRDPQALSVIEWADRATAFLPKDRIDIRLRDGGGDCRVLLLEARGVKSSHILRSCVGREHSGH